MALHKSDYQPARTRVEQGSTRFGKGSSLFNLHCTLLAFMSQLCKAVMVASTFKQIPACFVMSMATMPLVDIPLPSSPLPLFFLFEVPGGIIPGHVPREEKSVKARLFD